MIPKSPASLYELSLEAPQYVADSPEQLSIRGKMVFTRPVAVDPNMSLFAGIVILEQGGHAQR
jgi:hypothetical protein